MQLQLWRMLRSKTVLTAQSSVSEDGTAASVYEGPYVGRGTHRLECGSCGSEVAKGVDPYLYPVMFEGASHIRCSQCSSINALPIDL